jgi:hypothetical protein
MRVKSITWNQLYTLLGTQRNKSHPKLRSEPPPVSSTVILDRAADGPPNQVGRSVTHGQKPSKTCVLLPSLANGPPPQPGQSVFNSNPYRNIVGSSRSRGQSVHSVRTVWNLRADGPPFHRGLSAVTIHPPYVILYNSYKIVCSSQKCEINFVGFIMMSRSC